MTEAQYQNKIIKQLEANEYYVIKLIKTNKNGIPDLLALKKNRPPLFIEVKSATGKPSALQKFRIEELNDRGFIALVSYAK